MENNILEAEEGDTVQEELPDFAKSYVLSKKKQMKGILKNYSRREMVIKLFNVI